MLRLRPRHQNAVLALPAWLLLYVIIVAVASFGDVKEFAERLREAARPLCPKTPVVEMAVLTPGEPVEIRVTCED